MTSPQRRQKIQFNLVVDDFCVECMGEERTLHIKAALNKQFEEVSTDWKAELFFGIKLD